MGTHVRVHDSNSHTHVHTHVHTHTHTHTYTYTNFTSEYFKILPHVVVALSENCHVTAEERRMIVNKLYKCIFPLLLPKKLVHLLDEYLKLLGIPWISLSRLWNAHVTNTEAYIKRCKG